MDTLASVKPNPLYTLLDLMKTVEFVPLLFYGPVNDSLSFNAQHESQKEKTWTPAWCLRTYVKVVKAQFK